MLTLFWCQIPISTICKYLFIYTRSLAPATLFTYPPLPHTFERVDAICVVTSWRRGSGLRWRRDSTVGRADSANGYEVQFVDLFVVNLLPCCSEESVHPLCLAGCPQVSERSAFGAGCGCFSVCFEALSEGSALRSRQQQQQQTPKRASSEEKCQEYFTWALKYHRGLEPGAI